MLACLATPAAASGSEPILKEYARFYHPVALTWHPGDPEVIEFFSYNCNYCYAAEKSVAVFKKTKPADIRFQAYEVAYDNVAWQLSQYAFAAASLAGVEEQVHADLFHRFNVDKKLFDTKADVVDFFRSEGLLEKVQPYLESDASKDLRMKIYQMAVDAEVTRTPTFVVKGQYVVYWGTDQDPGKFADLLVALARVPRKN
nr:thiol:disulfide interchange protein DsbA/DsbL [Luteibacter yeojuensis]